MFESEDESGAPAAPAQKTKADQAQDVVNEWFSDMFSNIGPDMTSRLYDKVEANRKALGDKIAAVLK